MRASLVKQLCAEHGFDLCGIIRAEQSPQFGAYLNWIEQGYHAELGYMARLDRVARRENPAVILPGVRSMIVIGATYPAASSDPAFNAALHDPRRGRIAAYAWYPDYHEVITPRLEALVAAIRDAIREQGGSDLHSRAYVDTGAILERSHANSAGLGFIGKNTMLIQPRGGSYLLLGELLTDLEFDIYDTPAPVTLCGTCTRCQTKCPTQAFPRPYVLDARRCISYHTIENKGSIPAELRGSFGNWIMGCDICQDVCPFNRFASLQTQSLFTLPDIGRAAPLLSDLLTLDLAGFAARFHDTPIQRVGYERLIRNACIAAGNSGDLSLIDLMQPLASHNSALIREHAAWGLARLLVNS